MEDDMSIPESVSVESRVSQIHAQMQLLVGGFRDMRQEFGDMRDGVADTLLNHEGRIGANTGTLKILKKIVWVTLAVVLTSAAGLNGAGIVEVLARLNGG